jgi:UDP-N-acetylglucosamine acyltransferase
LPKSPEIHPTAIVAPDARIGDDSRIGPYVIIESDVALGARCQVHAFAVIKSFTEMGDDNVIHERCTLGGAPQHLRYGGEETHLKIGSGNTFRESVTAHRAFVPGESTTIGSHNLLMVDAHVAHDCRVGDHNIFANGTALAGHVEVGDHVVLGGGAMVHQWCHIGRHAMVGAMSAVRQDVLPFSKTSGFPARTLGTNAVGLKSAGFSREDMALIKRALHILFRKGQSREDNLAALRAVGSPHTDLIVDFVQSSRRGICRLGSASK